MIIEEKGTRQEGIGEFKLICVLKSVCMVMGETKRLGKIAVREGLIYLKFWGKISVDIIYLVLETSAQHLIGFILL
jgi:hypothetical protein